MMAGYDNNDNNEDSNRPLAQHLWLGAVETVINGFIDLDSDTGEQLVALSGLIVRVKLADPYLSFYLYFTPEGIEVCDVAPGPARVRVNARLYDLLRLLLGKPSTSRSGRPRVRLWGDATQVARLEALLNDFNLRTRAREWLQGHLDIRSLWERIRRHDPSWLQDVLPLPGLMRDALGELRQLNRNLQQQQEDMARFRHDIGKQRTQDLLYLLLAFMALLGGLTGGFSTAALAELNAERLLLLVAGLALVLSRLRDRLP
ncbi:MAG: SCP2 sterol-binding domain-containing protein [Moraxellaceae bacterium]|nr:SCP2 sterol-binding domain-containing protein [Moraxellaceae bacterium]